MAASAPSARVYAPLRLVRPGNLLVSFAGTLVGGLAARGMGIAWDAGFAVALLLAGLSTAGVTAAGNVLNDILDRDVDRVNHPDRPLVTGAVSVAGARRLATALFVLAGLAMVPLALAHPWLPVIFVAAIASLLAYEFRLKADGLGGNALVAFLTAAVFLYGGAVTSSLLTIVPFAAMAFGATLSREVIKDMEDAAGDVDRQTLPRVHGLRPASAVARLAVGASIALSPVPLVSFLSPFSAEGIMYLALVLAADSLIYVSLAWLPARLHREQSLRKNAMTVALLAFLAASFR